MSRQINKKGISSGKRDKEKSHKGKSKRYFLHTVAFMGVGWGWIFSAHFLPEIQLQPSNLYLFLITFHSGIKMPLTQAGMTLYSPFCCFPGLDFLSRPDRLPLLSFIPQPTAIWLPLLITPWKPLWPKSIMTSLLLNSMDTFLSSSYQHLCRIWHGWPLSPSWKFLLPWFLWQHLLLGFLLSGHYFSVYFPWFCLLLSTLQIRDH